MMGDRSNFAALEWVIGEIGDTLNDARDALESYVEDPRDTSRIRFCLTHIHQVHGSLQMVEFHGASLFAEEMEQLAAALMHGRVVNEKEAQEVLMRSLLQLPHYLEQVKNYQEDHPAIVLPLLNDIRAVRKQGYLSETNLFNPDLTPLERVTGERHAVLNDTAKLREIIKKLKEMYQFAAASVLRGIKIDENLAYIDKAFGRLEGVTRGTRAHALWQVAAALLEALLRDDVELSVAVRGLLRQLAAELRQMEEHSPQVLDAPVNEALLRNLLFYVARAEDGGAKVAAVKARFALDSALLGGAAERDKTQKGLISAPDPGAVRAVIVALRDELNTVKQLMTVSLSGQGGVSDLEEMLPVVKRIGDTLAVLGIGDMRKLTMDQFDALKKMAASGKVSENELIDVAGRLADIENRLEAIAKGAGRRADYTSVDEREVEFDSAKEAVLAECRAGLERVKEAIVEAMSAQWNPSQLPIAVTVIKDIEGGLRILPLPRPAAILNRCGQFIRETLSKSEETPGEELQLLADAIASVDYYLERLAGTHGDELESYLDLAEESLAQLGMEPSEAKYSTGFGESSSGAPSDLNAAAAQGLDEQAEQGTTDTLTADHAEAAQSEAESSQPLAAGAGAALAGADETDAGDDHAAGSRDMALGADERPEGITQSASVSGAPATAASSPTESEAGALAHEPDDPYRERRLPSELQREEGDPELDEEIIEIFIEESAEVLATLQEYFPKWQQDLDDSDALGTVRRAFHTLKGSGRMVEAFDVGELAWAVERMLNRVMDASVRAEGAHARLIERVIDFLPALMEAFRTQAPTPDRNRWFTLQDQANSLAKGEIPRELSFDFQAPEAATEAFAEDAPAAAEATGDAPVDDVAPEPELGAEEDDEDQILWEIFASEAETHLAVVDEFLAAMEQAAPLYEPPTDALQSALHTLKGSAHMAGVKAIAAVIAPLEGFFKELRSYQVKVDKPILALLGDCADYSRQGLELIERREPVVIEGEQFLIERIAEQHTRVVEPLIHAKEHSGDAERGPRVDPKLLSLFMSEGMRMLLDADEYIAKWRGDPASLTADAEPIGVELETLEQAAYQANLPRMQKFAALLGRVYEALRQQALAVDEQLFDSLAPAHEKLLDMVDQVAAGQNIAPLSDALVESIEALLAAGTRAETPDSAVYDTQPVGEESEESFLYDISEEFSDGFSEDEINRAAEAHAAAEHTDHAAEEQAEESASGEYLAAETAEQGDALTNEETTYAEFEELGEGADGELAAPNEVAGPAAEDADADATAESGSLADYADRDPGDYDLGAYSSDAGEPTGDDEVQVAEPYGEAGAPETAGETAALEEADAGQAPAVDDELPLEPGFGAEQEAESADLEGDEDELPLASDTVNENFEAGEQDSADNLELLDDLASHEQASDPLTEAPAELHEDLPAVALPGGEPGADDAEDQGFSDAHAETDESAVTQDHGITEEQKSTGHEQAFTDAQNLPGEQDITDQPGFTDQQDFADQPSFADDSAAEMPAEPPAEAEPAAPAAVHVPEDSDDVAAIDSDDFDPDILEIFLEEASELIEELDEAIHTWESNWEDADPGESMKRALHTLKGGARLSGLSRLGDLTHNYESYLITQPTPSEAFFADVHRYQDTLLAAVKSVRARLDGEQAPTVDAPAIDVPEVPDDTRDLSPAEAITPAQSGVMPSADVLPFIGKPREPAAPAGDAQEVAQTNRGVGESGKRQGPQEMIKVSADLLEELVNLAGETSISRGRLEQQVSDLGSAVDEVDATLRRLNEQLRRLDIETEAQVLFRQEQMAQHEQFDPLEMDRYSHLQQLTRSLMESSSDLVDLKLTISDKLRDTETLLLQQQRINSSLQEGLMRSRMVPFSRLVPRLRRIVRQVSGELGKHVNFELDNVEGEMDRSVLERMVAPLEHMLRNAVDHGIESPAQREQAGKPETGRILLSLAREGGDILLRLADDGRGIDKERVRQKAIERGLMTEDAQLTDHDIMQFILQAGFSTAENVTQISGRGVGMDVVAAEIKQLGGSMTIDSKAGVGTQFVVRLPFTVSVNRALMVQLGNEVYAIPLNTIEGIVRVSPFELEHYYSHTDARFEYAGENYQVRYLGNMVNPELTAKLDGQLLPLPVILVRSGQLTMALQVDSLSGSREIVVKSLGPQFAAVQGVSGATVMGDGSVVVILDPHAMVRREMATSGAALKAAEPEADKALPKSTLRTIMVVDDSVTVRKVTTRFLEREGFNVITAKDGVDALQVLQESTPDLMLLDIEMPRMDGFEVARNMRSTQRWKHTPIIMITSRTGDKHRQHAFSIGVNEYMGKPYQEEALLRAINTLLAKKTASA